MVDFFFYGTLLDAEVRKAVVGRAVPDEHGEPAVLEGYKRVAVRGASYPAILPEPTESVPGMVFRGFDTRECARLSQFEGENYVGRRRVVALSAGGTDRPWVYMPAGRVPALVGRWDFDAWSRRHRRRFLAAARQFARTQPPDEIRRHELAWKRRLAWAEGGQNVLGKPRRPDMT